jgi:hypothetical protein
VGTRKIEREEEKGADWRKRVRKKRKESEGGGKFKNHDN